MWRIAAATFMVAGLVISGGRAVAAPSTPGFNLLPELASPYRQYDLKLRSFCPVPSRPAGVLLLIRINGGRPLRMVLDSGAEFMVIGAKAARSNSLSAEWELELVGLGSRPAKVGRAATVEVGPVTFRNCRVAVVNGKVIEGADGVIPLSFFSEFRVRLDLPGKTLGLIPYPREENLAIPPGRAFTKHPALLVATVVNGKQSGYVILDTGAYCSAVSGAVARTLSGSQFAPEVQVAAGTGAATARRLSSTVHFAIAGQVLIPDEVVALDLLNLSRHYGVEVAGVLGFSALSHSVLTVDYRFGQVKIEPPASTSTRRTGGSIAASPEALAFHE